MAYYVWWSTGRYEGQNFDEFTTENDVLEFLNKNAKNTDFSFTVIDGREIKFKPVSIVQAYERE